MKFGNYLKTSSGLILFYNLNLDLYKPEYKGYGAMKSVYPNMCKKSYTNSEF